ncbi:MAG: response regulator transcription factor [Pseudomonadota bacterium]
MRIALLEDDQDQSDIVSRWLADVAHHISVFSSGEQFLPVTHRESFDLFLIDWDLGSGISGVEVLRHLREQRGSKSPIIFITAKDAENDIVAALDAGADDYLVKPLRAGELVARVRAMARRAGLIGNADDHITFGEFTFQPGQCRVTAGGEPVELTRREFELALFLFRHAGSLVSRQHVLRDLWGIKGDSVYTRTVDTHISRIRKKLGLSGQYGWKLSSVYQRGYRLSQESVNADS